MPLIQNKIFNRAFFVALALQCTLDSASAQSVNHLPPGVQAGPQAEGISEYRLANGLKVLLFPDQSKASTTVNITYRVGSREENYGETGMAHLLEHLLFKGTPQHKNIPQEMGKRGMQFNATTETDRTNYFESFTASDANLTWALDLEADRMLNSFIAKKDLDSEMTVVRNEFEAGENSPFGVLFKRMLNGAFDWHNVGKATIGNRSDIENVKINNLQNFYRNYYQPDNAVLLVAGKFDAAKTLAHISKRFGAIAKPKRSLAQAWTVEPTQDGERSVVVRRVGSTQIIAVGYKIPAALHADSDALQAAGDMLAGSANARLHKLLVESGKAAQVISYGKNGIDPGLMIVAAVVKQGDPIEPVQAAIINAMENFEAPSAEELARYQRRMALRYEELLNDPAATAQAISDAIAQGDWRLLFKGRDDLQKLTLEGISAASKKYFQRDNRIIASFIPDDKPKRAEMPTTPSVAQVLADYKPRLAQKAAEEFDPSQANIEARTQRSKIGEVKIALLPKSSRGDQVIVEMQLHYGDAENTKGKSWAATFSQAMLTTGTSKFNRQQLADEMDKVKLSGSPSSFQTTKENLVAALDLACHVMREPTFPESEFVQMKQKFKVSLAQKKTDPQSLASNALQEYFNPWPTDDVRAYMSVDQQLASLDKLTFAEVKDFYQQFHGASHGEVAIVGAFDVAQAKEALQHCFANWPSKANYVRLDEKNKAVAGTRQIIPAPDKENAVYAARLNLELGRDDDDFALVMLADHMFGSSGMSSRLGERARQKDGLSYGIGSQLHVGDFDRAGSLSIMAIVAPQNVTKLEAAIKEELQKTLQTGFSAAELAQAKSGLLQQRRLARTDDGALASGLNSLSFKNQTYAYSAELDKKLQAATLEQVNAAWQRKIKANDLAVFIAVDEAKMRAANK